jgi:pimeloyl-ACP methyl ester carboxylesterase
MHGDLRDTSLPMPDDLSLKETLAATGAVPEGPDAGILEPYHGAVPAAPAWAEQALLTEPEAAFLDVEGAQVEVLAWGKRGAPGILLLHGNGAHARWWSFLAPLIAAEGYRVAALSFSGMGASDWREHYTMDLFAAEMEAASDWAGLAASGRAPVLAGHSFGGFPALVAFERAPQRWSALVTLDSSIPPPQDEWRGPPTRSTPNRIYGDLVSALARFRLAPPQPCANHWALDWIARHSLKAVEGGWTWRFDPFMWQKFERPSSNDVAARLSGRIWVLRGERSILMDARTWDYMQTLFPRGTRFVTVPQARHHMMLDEPLAVAAVLNTILADVTTRD